jgi:hypothetical protein
LLALRRASGNVRIEIAAARILDAHREGHIIPVGDVADVDDFLFAARHTGQL